MYENVWRRTKCTKECTTMFDNVRKFTKMYERWDIDKQIRARYRFWRMGRRRNFVRRDGQLSIPESVANPREQEYIEEVVQKGLDVLMVLSERYVAWEATRDGFHQTIDRLLSTGAGSRSVQTMICRSAGKERAILLSALQGKCKILIVSPHGNHVLQQAVITMPPGMVRFIWEEIVATSPLMCVHRDSILLKTLMW